MLQPRFWVVTGLILIASAMKVLPYVLGNLGVDIDPQTTVYPWNFSAMTAICLFAGGRLVFQKNYGWLPFVIPLAAWTLSDLAIWAVTGKQSMGFYDEMFAVYGCFLLTVALGLVLRSRAWWTVLPMGLLAEILFYVITNFACWAVGNGDRYPHTLEGLGKCYTFAVPFFRQSLVSTMIYGTLLFGGLAFLERVVPALEARRAPQPTA